MKPIAFITACLSITLIAVPLTYLVRRNNDREDFFEGTKVAAEGGCVPQGLPDLAHVDSQVPVEV